MLTVTLSFKRSQNKDRYYDAHTEERGITFSLGDVYGSGVENLRAVALAEARKVLGDNADLKVVSPFTVRRSNNPAKGEYMAAMQVREIVPRGSK